MRNMPKSVEKSGASRPPLAHVLQPWGIHSLCNVANCLDSPLLADAEWHLRLLSTASACPSKLKLVTSVEFQNTAVM